MCPLGNLVTFSLRPPGLKWWRECGLCARLETPPTKRLVQFIKMWRECGLCARLETSLRQQLIGTRLSVEGMRAMCPLGNAYACRHTHGSGIHMALTGWVEGMRAMCPLGNWYQPIPPHRFKIFVEGMRAMCPLGNANSGKCRPQSPKAWRECGLMCPLGNPNIGLVGSFYFLWRECGLCARLETKERENYR